MQDLQNSTASFNPFRSPTEPIPYKGYMLNPFQGGEILDLLPENDDALYQASERYDFNSATQEETDKLVLDLASTMRHNKGIGLSAIQVGIPKQVFVIETGADTPFAMFNTKLIDLGDDIELEEGCLSFPGLILKVKRPKNVRVRFQDNVGAIHTYNYEGLSARVVMHEWEHGMGHTFIEQVSKLTLDLAKKKRAKRNR